MSSRLSVIKGLILTASIAHCCAGALATAQMLNVIPSPETLEIRAGSFPFSVRTVIKDPMQRFSAGVEAFLQIIARSGIVVQPGTATSGTSGIAPVILLSESQSYPDFGYLLSVTENQIKIEGQASGVFTGLMTLAQLVLATEKRGDTILLPCLLIKDRPRFGWRGMHLDVIRHFFPVEFIKKYLDLLALYKFNVFHWHLTDDQGWRLEIKAFPELTAKGSVRKGSMVGPYDAQKFDTVPYGGYYTQEEVKEILAYAAARHIIVVPEIEMPGHAMAALSVFPHLSCTGGPFEVARAWGVFEDVFCTREETFEFLEKVLTEVAALFPGPYIHIGGDECPKTRWKACPVCQINIQKYGLKDEHELQSYFIRRAEAILARLGKKLIGWDEILEGGLAATATVMSWRGIEGGIAAARKGNDAVMTPVKPCYFDHRQIVPEDSLTIGGYNPLSSVYAYEPVPGGLSDSEKKHILGAQGNVWTEYMIHPGKVEYMTLPRLPALAEVLWSQPDRKDFDDFKRRLSRHKKFWQSMGLNFCDKTQ